jgi:hypothetical protein
MVGWLTKQFANAKRRDERSDFPSLGIAIMWSALHRPQLGEMMREKVSEVLRRDGKAHISWHFSPTAGPAIAVGDSFADLERLAKAAPRDRVMAILKQPHSTVQQH